MQVGTPFDYERQMKLFVAKKMPDPRVGVTSLARVGHFFGDEQFHLPLVIKRRADLQKCRRLAADSFRKIVQRRRRRARDESRGPFPALVFRLSTLGLGFHGQSGTGHDDARVALKQPAAQKFRHVNRRGVQPKIFVRLAAAFDPVNVVAGALFEKCLHLVAQFGEPAVALDQFLPDVLVLAQFDELADCFAEALNRQRNVVLHQFGAADAEFGPCAAAFGAFAAESGFAGGFLDFLTRGLDIFKKLVGFAQNVGDEFHRISFSQRGEQALFRARIPQAIQRPMHLPARHAQADVPRRDVLHLVRLVENHEVVLEQNAAFLLFINSAEQREKQCVVQHQHIRGKELVPRALEMADAVILGEIGRKAADFWRAQPALRTNLRPDFRVRLDVKIRQAAVLGFLRPFVDALQFLGLGRREQIAGLLHRLLQPARAEIIRAALEHRITELHRHRERAEHIGEHRQVFFRELLLQIDGVRGDNGLFLLRNGEQNRRNKIGERFADAGARLDGEMFTVLQRPRHGYGHFLLLRTELEILRARQNARRRKDFLDLGNQIRADGLVFND